jgi:hypothetical protein
MGADLIRLHGDRHRQVQELLPWYCTGHIDAGDRAIVETHLAECPACQAELRIEARLSREVAALPLELELGWLDVRDRLRIGPSLPVRFRTMLLGVWHGLESGEYARWAVAAQIGILLLLVSLVSAPDRTARYHALGSSAAAPVANVIVMFKPDTPESELRQSLAAAGARLVDGPTPAGAYVLYIAPDHRRAALTMLREKPAILMAEAIDEGVSQ